MQVLKNDSNKVHSSMESYLFLNIPMIFQLNDLLCQVHDNLDPPKETDHLNNNQYLDKVKKN